MEIEIKILNVMQWEKDGKRTGKLSFIIPNISKTDNYMGISDVSCFYKLDLGEDFVGKFPKEIILQPVKAMLLERPNFKDKLAVSRIIESIKYNGRVISLLQSEQR